MNWESHPFHKDIVVSDTGVILSYKRGFWYELVQNESGGYLRVAIGHSNPIGVHRLVGETFIFNEDPERKTEVNHKDGCKINNCVKNLEWATRQENMIHARNLGLHNPNGRNVMVVETGRVYTSIAECARQIDGIEGNLAHCLLGNRNTHRGYHFKYWEGPTYADRN